MNAWECYWVDAIHRGDTAAGQRAHDELDRLLATNVFEAPAGASEDWVPSPFPTVPFATFAHDGGLDWIREGYDRAAAGHPRPSGPELPRERSGHRPRTMREAPAERGLSREACGRGLHTRGLARGGYGALANGTEGKGTP